MENNWCVIIKTCTQNNSVSFEVVNSEELKEVEGIFSLKDKTLDACIEHLRFIAKKEGEAATLVDDKKLIIQAK